MGSREIKIEKVLSVEELSGFFNQVIEGLEAANSLNELGVDLHDFSKVSISLKRRQGQVMMKLKVEHDRTASGEEEDLIETDHPDQIATKYKTLKKSMKTGMKVMAQFLSNNELPPRLVVQSFLSQANQMITFPGKGDEHYLEFGKECDDLKVAFDQGDVNLMRIKCDALNSLKKQCHAQFK
ncbi:MAG: GAK system XXXCH domain-containing protein [Deltaproteobacteria bacterium]|nr:GAK system XXXCH domain-containing protein [Deltaproteobacteria bacterium]MBF0523488.1 GAK system XXXCH domain-containing protein [Deltaproteobacteria bacterium]